MATKAKAGKKGPASANGVPASPDVLTLAEAAAFLRVPNEVLVREAESGRVPGRKLGSEWRFGRAKLLDWLAQPEPGGAGGRKSMSSVIGAFKDDETLEPMVEEIYRQRKQHRVGS
jgi:excisionase family DNA binding protein